MDELFDRIKAAKINRKYLIISLITTEIFGIFVLIWFLRTPLSQKFLTTEPKAYSVHQFNNKTRYLLNQGDFLTGSSEDNSVTAVLFTTGNDLSNAIKSKIQPNLNNNWSYQIPTDLDEGIYLFTVANLKDNQVTSTKSYRVRILSNDLLLRNSLLKKIFLRDQTQTLKSVQQPLPQRIYPQLFYTDLEYDIKNNSVNELRHGLASNEPMFLNPKPASPSADLFTYKLVISSENGRIIQEGWDSLLKDARVSDGNTLKFQIRATNQPGSEIKIFSLNDSLLWQGEIPK